MPLDGLAIPLGTLGTGEWELELADRRRVTVFLDGVYVHEDRGFLAEGHNEAREMLVELTTGKQPGGPIRLRRRPLDSHDWETVGELVDAVKRE